jgi:hypothetical protein
MNAWVLRKTAPIDDRPLELFAVATPKPVAIRVA